MVSVSGCKVMSASGCTHHALRAIYTCSLKRAVPYSVRIGLSNTTRAHVRDINTRLCSRRWFARVAQALLCARSKYTIGGMLDRSCRACLACVGASITLLQYAQAYHTTQTRPLSASWSPGAGDAGADGDLDGYMPLACYVPRCDGCRVRVWW